MKSLLDDLDRVDENIFIKSEVNPHDSEVKDSVRKSQHCWIPSTHWIGGFLWHYIRMANKDNFLYDISDIENNMIQYTQYNKGDFYKWHTDMDICDINEPDQLVRKLSFTVQLTNDDEYTGGNLEFADFDDNTYRFLVPKSRGTVIVFDSRTPHRVTPVESGIRKSLVGWVVGKRWR
jgi:PKHD-type hydroxylase